MQPFRGRRMSRGPRKLEALSWVNTGLSTLTYYVRVVLGKGMFYLTTHSTHFIYGYMASDIWLRTILIVKKKTRCRHIGYSFRLTARVLLYAPSHRQDSTYHGIYNTSRGALAGTRNSSVGSPHEGSIRRYERTLLPRSWGVLTKYVDDCRSAVEACL